MGNNIGAGLFDSLGLEEDFDNYNPFPDSSFEPDAPNSPNVLALMALDTADRRLAFRSANYPESSVLTCICLEAAQDGSDLVKQDAIHAGRRHTHCFTGYDFVKWLKTQKYVSHKHIGEQIAQKMLHAKLFEHVRKRQIFQMDKEVAEYIFLVGDCVSRTVSPTPALRSRSSTPSSGRYTNARFSLSSISVGGSSGSSNSNEASDARTNSTRSALSSSGSGSGANANNFAAAMQPSDLAVRGWPANSLKEKRRSTKRDDWDKMAPDPILRHKFVCLSAKKKLDSGIINHREYTHIVKVSGDIGNIRYPFDPKFMEDSAITPQGKLQGSAHSRGRVSSSDFNSDDDETASDLSLLGSKLAPDAATKGTAERHDPHGAARPSGHQFSTASSSAMDSQAVIGRSRTRNRSTQQQPFERSVSARWDKATLPDSPFFTTFVETYKSQHVLLLLYHMLFHPANFSDAQQRRFLECLEEEQFAAGEYVVQEGTPPSADDCWYVVLRGCVAIFKRQPDGTRKKVVKLPVGEFFGESALLTDQPRSATVVAEGSTNHGLATPRSKATKTGSGVFGEGKSRRAPPVCSCLKMRKALFLGFCAEAPQFKHIMLNAKEHIEHMNRAREQAAHRAHPDDPEPQVPLLGISSETGVLISRVMRKRRSAGRKEITSARRTYHVDRILGRGQQGKVKLIYDVLDKRKYAMKVIKRSGRTRHNSMKRNSSGKSGHPAAACEDVEDPLKQIKSEISILKKMRHPNVVLLHEVIDDPRHKKLYLVQEYVEGGAAMDERHLAEGCQPLPYRVAWRLFRDMLNGLDYLHRNRVVHRDLKPSNILVDANMQAKIADFGVSTVLDNHSDAIHGTEGSPIFMAPEVCGVGDGSAYSGQAADMYSAGATLYAFVFGRVPFPASNFMELVEQKQQVRSHVTMDLEPFVLCRWQSLLIFLACVCVCMFAIIIEHSMV